MDNSTQMDMLQDRVFRTDAIRLAKAVCPDLMLGEWDVVLNALNGHRTAITLDEVEEDAVVFYTRTSVADVAHMAAGTHPDWPDGAKYPDTGGAAEALTREYPAWTDMQWQAVSLLAQAVWHYDLPADELPMAGE